MYFKAIKINDFFITNTPVYSISKILGYQIVTVKSITKGYFYKEIPS